MPLFDAYVMVDWSGAARPTTGKDSIWWALVERTENGVRLVDRANPSTRADTARALADLLCELLSRQQRTLVGFDFPFGYSYGTARRLGLSGTPWKATWALLAEMIQDNERNGHNAFDVAEEWNRRMYGESFPFWGNVREEVRPFLVRRGRRPHGQNDVAERRIADVIGRTPSPVWKLAGAGSVGAQALTGIPRVWQLRNHVDLKSASRIWPLETGLRADWDVPVILAEVFPGIVDPAPETDMVKDARQVRTVAEHLAGLDDIDGLARYFEVGDGLGRRDRSKIEREEAYILGIGGGPAV